MSRGISLELGRRKLKEMVIKDVNSSENNMVYVYRVQAGLGKTHLIINELLGSGVIAFPTHKLKNENYLKINNSNIKITEDLFESITHSSKREELLDYFEKGNKFMINKLLDVKPQVEICSNTLTTHHKTMNSPFSKEVSNIYYDEDPSQTFMYRYVNNKPSNFSFVFESLFKRGFITSAELNNMKRFINSVNKIEFPKKIRVSPFRKDLAIKIKTLISKMNLNLRHDVVEFLEAEYFSNKSYSLLKTFPEDKNIFIFSATPDISMIKEISKKSNKKVKIRTITNVIRKGTIEQKLISTTRNGMKKNEDKLKEELDKNSNVTLTFKNNSAQYNSNSNIPYGGNAQGYDGLKGSNINVAYTFQYIPDYYYHKYSIIYKKQLIDSDIKMKHLRVNWYKKEFIYYSYVNEKLREIVFNHIDSEMIQALERSRTISEKCTSTILSNFICSIMPMKNVKCL